MYILVLCNVILLTSRDFLHHHFYYCFSFCGFTYLLISFFGVFLRKFDGHVFKFLQSSVRESTLYYLGIANEEEAYSNQLLLSALLSTESASFNALPVRDLSTHARGATSSHNDFSDHSMVWPGSSEEPHLRAKSPHEKTVEVATASQLLLETQWVPGYRSFFLIVPGMWLIWIKQNCTNVRCSTFMLQSK